MGDDECISEPRRSASSSIHSSLYRRSVLYGRAWERGPEVEAEKGDGPSGGGGGLRVVSRRIPTSATGDGGLLETGLSSDWSDDMAALGEERSCWRARDGPARVFANAPRLGAADRARHSGGAVCAELRGRH